MNSFVITFAFVLIAAGTSTGSALPQGEYQAARPSYGGPSAASDAPAQYRFDWKVEDPESGNNFGQDESRDGDQTSGSYYVALPDGRLQKVTYTVDAYNGYQAEVTYEGEAKYPEAAPYKPTPAPYKPAPYQPSPAPTPAPYQQPARY